MGPREGVLIDSLLRLSFLIITCSQGGMYLSRHPNPRRRLSRCLRRVASASPRRDRWLGESQISARGDGWKPDRLDGAQPHSGIRLPLNGKKPVALIEFPFALSVCSQYSQRDAEVPGGERRADV